MQWPATSLTLRARGAGGVPARKMLAMMGKQKAAVLPEPVCAQAMRSRPAMPMGMEYRCTGVGFVYLHRCTLAISAWPRSTSAGGAERHYAHPCRHIE